MNQAALHLIEHLEDNCAGWLAAWCEYEEACAVARRTIGTLISGELSPASDLGLPYGRGLQQSA